MPVESRPHQVAALCGDSKDRGQVYRQRSGAQAARPVSVKLTPLQWRKSRPPAVARRRSEGVWLDIAPGVPLKMLRVVDAATGERTALLQIEPGLSCPEHDHSEVEECLSDYVRRVYRNGRWYYYTAFTEPM